MRRVPALVGAGLALLLTAAACGGDDGGNGNGSGGPTTPPVAAPPSPPDTEGTASTEEVCAAGEDLIDSLDTEGAEVRESLIDAAASGDAAELQQAQADYLTFASGLADDMRDISETAEDPGLQSALESFANEFETVATEVAANPEEVQNVDTSGLAAAGAEIAIYCE